MWLLDQNCELDQDWMVSTTNGDIVVDCDYYDAEVEAFANGSASFSGKGTGRGTLSVVMRAKGKINVDAQTEKLKVVFSDPESTENQTITVKGSAHDVIIEAIGAQLNKQKLNMQLSDVNQVRFEVSLDVGKIAQPTTEEEEEQLRDMVRKSMKNISLKKVKDSSGTPVQEVTYKVSGSDGPGIIPWKLEWTEAWSGK